MIQKIRDLKEQFINAKSPEEKAQIDAEMQRLINEDSEAWADAMVETLKETTAEARQIRVRQQLENILHILPLSHIAEEYFGKSKSWIYQRLNGNEVNGKPAKFTDEEIQILNNALQDLSKKIGSVKVA